MRVIAVLHPLTTSLRRRVPCDSGFPVPAGLSAPPLMALRLLPPSTDRCTARQREKELRGEDLQALGRPACSYCHSSLPEVARKSNPKCLLRHESGAQNDRHLRRCAERKGKPYGPARPTRSRAAGPAHAAEPAAAFIVLVPPPAPPRPRDQTFSRPGYSCGPLTSGPPPRRWSILLCPQRRRGNTVRSTRSEAPAPAPAHDLRRRALILLFRDLGQAWR